jgi:hypothetical protein
MFGHPYLLVTELCCFFHFDDHITQKRNANLKKTFLQVAVKRTIE